MPGSGPVFLVWLITPPLQKFCLKFDSAVVLDGAAMLICGSKIEGGCPAHQNRSGIEPDLLPGAIRLIDGTNGCEASQLFDTSLGAQVCGEWYSWEPKES